MQRAGVTDTGAVGLGIRALAAAAAMLLLTGCPGGELNFFQEKEEYVLEIRNETDRAVEIFRLGATSTERREWMAIPPNSADRTWLVDECSEHSFVAEFEDGSEAGRIEPPVCDGDVWVIGDS